MHGIRVFRSDFPIGCHAQQFRDVFQIPPIHRTGKCKQWEWSEGGAPEWDSEPECGGAHYAAL